MSRDLYSELRDEMSHWIATTSYPTFLFLKLSPGSRFQWPPSQILLLTMSSSLARTGEDEIIAISSIEWLKANNCISQLHSRKWF